MIDFDIILRKLGGFGTYQVIVCLSLAYYALSAGMNAIAPVFISYTPEYRCKMPFDGDAYETNLTYEEKMNLTTPVDAQGEPLDGCYRYNYNVTDCVASEDLSCVNKDEDNLIPCEDFYFDESLFTETTVTEFELICDRNFLNPLGSSIYMTGVLLGALVFGNICDRVGRKITIIVTGIGVLSCMLGTAYSRSVGLFFFMRCAVAFFSSGCNVALFSHLMEIVGRKWRTFVGIGYQCGFAIGYMLWSGVAYAYRDWHQMSLGSLVLSSPFAIIAILVPESPRWLFAKERNEEGKRVVAIMEKYNKVTIEKSDWEIANKNFDAKKDKKFSTLDLFRYKGMAKITVAISFNWFVNSLVYYGVSLSAGNLAGNIYLNNVYAGIFELISYVICILTMDRIGRRLLLTICLTGAGVSLLCSTVVNEYSDNDPNLVSLGVAFAFIGKAFVSGSFAVIYNFTSELYPTVVRANGLGFGSVSARIGSIISPFVIELSDFISWLPNLIFGCFALFAGLISMWFPDTTGRPIMETIEEAELFYSGKKHLPKKHNLDPSTQTYEKDVATDDEVPKNSMTVF